MLDRREPAGRYDITVRIPPGPESDALGDAVGLWYYRLDELPEEPDPEVDYVTEIPDPPRLEIALEGRGEVDDRIRLSQARPFAAVVPGATIRDARLEPDVPELQVDIAGSVVTVSPRRSVQVDDVELVVVIAPERELRTGSLSFVADDEAPRVVVTAPGADSAHRTMPRIEADIRDDLGVARVEVSLDGETWVAMEVEPPAPSPAESTNVAAASEEADEAGPDSDTAVTRPAADSGAESGPGGLYVRSLAPDADDGAVPFLIRAADGAGNLAYAAASFVLDRVEPALAVLTPAEADELNGRITVAVAIDDSSPIERIEWLPTWGEPIEVEPAPVVRLPLDLTLPAAVEDPSTTATGDEATAESSQAPAEASAESADANSVPVEPSSYRRTQPLVRVTDRAGNVAELPLRLNVTPEADRPQVTIQLPPDDAVQREDFAVSGTVFDDDGEAEILYRINDGELVSAGSASSFAIPVSIEDLGDNRHTITVVARDFRGVESEPQQVHVRVSLDSPSGSVEQPRIDETVRDRLELIGTAVDANGIQRVEVSLDNGVSFQDAEIVTSAAGVGAPNPDQAATDGANAARAEGATEETATDSGDGAAAGDSATAPEAVRQGEPAVEAEVTWRYAVESRVLTDGLHAIQYRITDVFDSTALFSTIVTIDNTPPAVNLDQPADGRPYSSALPLSGRVADGGALESVRYALTRIPGDGAEAAPGGPAEESPTTDGDQPGPATAAATRGRTGAVELLAGGVFRGSIDTAGLEPGGWNLEIRAVDQAGNVTVESRNLSIERDREEVARVVLLSPLAGAQQTGTMTISGRAFGDAAGGVVELLIDDRTVARVEPDENGYFSYDVAEDSLTPGRYEVMATAPLDGEAAVASDRHGVTISPYGPWIAVESHRDGELLSGRPFLNGTAGYRFPPPEGLEAGSREYRRAVERYEIETVEISLDNGRTFDSTNGTSEWSFRVETQNLAEGPMPVVIRVVAADGSVATRRMQLGIDLTAPEVTLLSPRENARFNDAITVNGTASDGSGVSQLELILRAGDKNRYEVPEFIQGLYTDVHFLGASTWDIGMGLTFFDDNVKLQAQVGVAPPGRFSGLVMGGKLLANVAVVPFSFLFGPDFDWLSGSLAVGANFSYFTMSDDSLAFTGDGLVLGGIVSQLEFPIIDNRNWRVLNTYSFYTELQFWFISSDVQGGTETKISFGLRTQLL